MIMANRKPIIYFVERNIHGAWVVWGGDGIKQYYGYTKRQAIEKYKQDYNCFYNQKERKRR